MKRSEPLRRTRPAGAIVWYCRLLRATEAGDNDRAAFCDAELKAIGVHVVLDRSWRTEKGALAE